MKCQIFTLKEYERATANSKMDLFSGISRVSAIVADIFVT